MASEQLSKCHNATVSPMRGGAEGDLKCDVCGNKAEVVSGDASVADKTMGDENEEKEVGNTAGEGEAASTQEGADKEEGDKEEEGGDKGEGEGQE